MAGNPTASLLIPNSATDSLQATSKILESNNLTPCFLIIAVDYKLQNALDLISNHGFTLPKWESFRHPSKHVTDPFYPDDIALLADQINNTKT